MVRSSWKIPFFDSYLLKKLQNIKVRQQKIKIWSRRSIILPNFVGYTFDIYNGQKFISLKVTETMIGHKFGEFIFTRKPCVHKKSNQT